MQEPLSVEAKGDLIEVCVAGVPTAPLLEECRQRVFDLVRITGRLHVLYDTRGMEAPPVDVTFAQRHMDEQLTHPLRRAIVVPNPRLAYLARLSFGEGDYRVFYEDIDAARAWLIEPDGD